MTARGSLRRRCAALACGVLPAAAPCAGSDYVIRIQDHHFVPAELHIPAGRKVQIAIENDDAVAEEFDSHSLNREKHIPPGTRVVLFIGPLEAGRYLYEGENDGGHGGAALGVVVAE